MIFIFQHPIADADFGEDILGLCGILFDFAADVSHIHTQNLVVAVHVRPPDGTHNLVVGEDFAGVLGQKCEELVFDLGQVNLFTCQGNQALFKIDFQVKCLVGLI